jgi:hypothetical protein
MPVYEKWTFIYLQLESGWPLNRTQEFGEASNGKPLTNLI